MPKITIEIGTTYTEDLKERLAKYGISHGRLAREIEVSASQMSRWFNREGMRPRMDNVVRIEEAIARIRAGKGKK